MTKVDDKTLEQREIEALLARSDDGRVAKLVVIRGSATGRIFHLEAPIRLGRGDGADIVLEDPGVSRAHAEIRPEDGGWVIDDLGSTNGTFVDGVPITTHRLRFGDRIEFGRGPALLFTLYHPIELQALQADRLTSLGRLASGVAHDMNNVLAAIMANVQFMQATSTTRPREEDASLGEIQQALERAASMTRQLLDFARSSSLELRPVRPGKVLQEVEALARRTFDPNIVLTVDVDESLRIVGDEGQLHQVFLNLLLNARDALPRGGTITVAARVREFSSPAISAARPGIYVEISITDNGIGMDAATASRAFEPFFTTKNRDGSGLGLATAYGIVRNHGGFIDVESKLGQGTTFRVFLPRAERTQTHSTTSGPLLPLGTKLAVLVVDDDELVLNATDRMLRSLGHDVTCATGGMEALQIIQSMDVDVVVLDLVMPDMDGVETLTRIRDERKRLPIVITTGCADEQRIGLARQQANGFLAKPYARSQIAASLLEAYQTSLR